MNWAWANSLDHIWRSPAFPMWLTLAAAGFFGIIVLITLLRAEKSVANGALTVITLLAAGIAVAATLRGFGPGASGETRLAQPISTALPALSCIDDMAGETVLTACEKTLFGSAESAAASVSYAASLITRLTASGDVTAANANRTPELSSLRRAVERDRYGLMAYVLLVRDHCTPTDCAAFRSLADRQKILANMDERTYDGLVSRYAPSWNAPAPAVPVAALPPSLPLVGKPTNADFPTAASTPAVSIMTPEPGSAPTPAAPRPPTSLANAPLPSPRPPAATTPAAAPTAGKKQTAQKSAKGSASAPISISPAASAPAAAND